MLTELGLRINDFFQDISISRYSSASESVPAWLWFKLTEIKQPSMTACESILALVKSSTTTNLTGV